MTSGATGVTVVLLHGTGLAADSWAEVQRRLDGRVASISVDRAELLAALGSRGRVTAAEQATHLRTLLDAAGVSGPLVLVGHSWGAAIARAFAHGAPDVLSLVLVDGTHEELDSLHDLSFRFVQGGAALLSRVPPTSRVAAVQELAGLPRSLRHATAPTVPVWAVTGGRASTRRGWRVRADFVAVYDRVATTHVVAGRAGHHVPVEAPEVVVSCVLEAVGSSVTA